MSMHKKNAYIFNTDAEIASAKQKVDNRFPQLRVTVSSNVLFVESRNSILFDAVVTDFIRSLGGIPRPADM